MKESRQEDWGARSHERWLRKWQGVANQRQAMIGKLAEFVLDANEMQLMVYDRNGRKRHIQGGAWHFSLTVSSTGL